MKNQMLIEKLKKTEVYKERTGLLTQIINPISEPCHSVDIEAYYVAEKLNKWGNRYGGLELYPDFQRGNDWDQELQVSYIENLLRGNVDHKGKTILLNIVGFGSGETETDIEHPVTILDGLQRYSAIQAFKNGEFMIFGGLTIQDLERSKYDLEEIFLKISIYNFHRKVDLVKFYKLINTTGKTHSKVEIDRITNMIDELEAKESQA